MTSSAHDGRQWLRAVLSAGVVALALLAAFGAAAQPKFPPLTGRVVDEAGLLSPAQKTDLDAKLAALERRTSAQVVIATLPSLQGYDIADFGYQLGRHWEIGQNDKNNGVLLLVAPIERKVRIEVGYGLEGALTDALTRIIIETSILPHFRAGDMAAGIVAGADDIIKVVAGEGQDVANRAIDRQSDDDSPLVAMFILLFLVLFIAPMLTAFFDPPGTAGGRRHGGRGGGWSGGGPGGWSGGSSGGFSGGGGSFGGGGSSGSW